MYFKDFDIIRYDFTVRGDATPIVENIVDLTQRVQLKISDEDLGKLCDEYIVPSGMKPEQVAFILYNDPMLHWTVLYVNSITDIHAEWPIDEVSLTAFVTKKYGEGNEYDTHHYEKMPERLWIDNDFCQEVYGESARLVSNYDYEYELNEEKRHIRVIKPAYLPGFVQAFKNATING